MRRLYTNHSKKLLRAKGGSLARKSKSSKEARQPTLKAAQVLSPTVTVNTFANDGFLHNIDIGDWKLRGYNIGVNSCGFVGYHNNTAVSGGSNVARERISIQGRPGTRTCVIDRYAVDKTFRGDKTLRHGQRLFECLSTLFRAAGSYEFVVTNPTGPGKKFYKRAGFVQDHANDYRFILNTVITTTV